MTDIPFIAGEIRHGRMPSFPAYRGVMPGVFLVDTDEFSDEVERVWRELSRTGQCLVLSTVKGGAAGIIGLNERLQSIAQDGRDVPTAGFLPGEPIIFGRNDYSRNLWNGSLGRIKRVFRDDEDGACLADFEGHPIVISDADLAVTDLAYAITVHRMQGCQAERVIAVLPAGRLLDRTMIYTALTRAVTQVVLVGQRSAIEAAVITPPRAHLRQVGLTI
jgi:exodeoxyribonuclease V alpha subunit